MHNFFYRPTNELFTPLALKMRGVDPDDIPGVRRAGYVLVIYDYPEFDQRTHYMEPKSSLTPKGEDFVQEFVVKPLSPEDLARALEQAKVEKLQSVSSTCDNLMKELVATYPDMEVSTFYKQEEEARAILAGEVPSTAMLAALAHERGIDIMELARRVIAKSEGFAFATGYFMGQRQKIEDKIDAAPDVATLDAIDIQFKPLPEVV